MSELLGCHDVITQVSNFQQLLAEVLHLLTRKESVEVPVDVFVNDGLVVLDVNVWLDDVVVQLNFTSFLNRNASESVNGDRLVRSVAANHVCFERCRCCDDVIISSD